MKHGAEFYRLLLDSFSYPLYVIDVSTYQVLFANIACGEDKAVGIRCHELTHNSSTPCTDEHVCPLDEVQKRKKAVVVNHVHYSTNGEPIHVEVHAHPIFDKDGSVAQIIEYSIDVTARVEAEEELRESNERFRLLSSSALDAIIMMNDDGKISFWNEAAARMFGYEANEIIGKDLHGTIAPKKYRDKFASAFVGYKDSGCGEAIGKTIELEGLRRDGSAFPISLSLSVMKEKERWLAFGILRDITEQKQHEKELRAAFEYQKLLVETAATAIFTVDQKQRITDINPAFTYITGFEREEVIGKHCSILRGEPCMQGCGLFNNEDNEPISRRSCQVTTKDGRALTILKNAELIVDDNGRAIGGVESFTDVTELTDAIKRAEAATETRSEFLANMSHEIRTPMNGIIGLSGLLLDTELSEEQREFATSIRASANSLLTVINDILDFSKIDAGHLLLDLFPYDLRKTTNQAVHLMAQRAQSKGLELIVDIGQEVPEAVLGDASRIKQILTNLISNAIKFTDEGTITVKVAYAKNELLFSVVDTGIGIAKDKVPILFNPFVQADSSTSRRFGGTGLGLSISKRLVELMGGEIGVESEEGNGSTFWFSLPHNKAKIDDVDHAERNEPVNSQLLSGKRILLIEDNEKTQLVLSNLLRSWNIDVIVKKTTEEALTYLQLGMTDLRPNVVLLDSTLCGDSCSEFIRTIHDDEENEELPIILMTTFVDNCCVSKSGTKTLTSLLKPIDPSRLYNELVGLFYTKKPQNANSSKQVESNLQEQSSLQRRRILLAEDNPVNSLVAKAILEKMGYRTDVAANGIEVLQALANCSYDLIFMDVQMPEMDGFQATKEVRELEINRDGHPIPIVAMTAHAMDGDRERCLASGMDDYLSKPVSKEELQKILNKWLHQL